MPGPLDDLHALDTRSMTWSQVKSKTASFTARLGHCMVAASLRRRRPVAERSASGAGGRAAAAAVAESRDTAADGTSAGALTATGGVGGDSKPRIKDVTPGFTDGNPDKNVVTAIEDHTDM